jgi:hypothetical protein
MDMCLHAKISASILLLLLKSCLTIYGKYQNLDEIVAIGMLSCTATPFTICMWLVSSRKFFFLYFSSIFRSYFGFFVLHALVFLLVMNAVRIEKRV